MIEFIIARVESTKGDIVDNDITITSTESCEMDETFQEIDD